MFPTDITPLTSEFSVIEVVEWIQGMSDMNTRKEKMYLRTIPSRKAIYKNRINGNKSTNLWYCLFLLEPAIDSNYYNIENIIKIVKNFYSNNLKIYLNDKYFENDQDKINFAESIKNIKDGSWEIELVVI